VTNQYKTDNLRIRGITEVVSPAQVHDECPITEAAAETVTQTRKAIHHILQGDDDRLIIIVGPCSVHDPKSAMEYAKKLQAEAERLKDDLLIIMRVYFEKPRTTVGWKGLINDPGLDESFEINKGLNLARKLLLDVNDIGLPAGTEFLDLISPQYIADLVSWGAIGARTTESQGHRELASGLSCPVGFKNGTNGKMQIAADAMRAAERPHVFMSLTKKGQSAIFSTTGNIDTHIILRGGKHPNYDAESVDLAASEMRNCGLKPRLMVDLSHANSQKDHRRQMIVGADVAGQVSDGDERLMGVMIESHLVEGRQDINKDQELTYGQSVTDACIAWDDTVPLLDSLAEAVQVRRENKS